MSMFIDISTYIGHWPFRNLEHNTLDGLDKLAQRYDITHMVVSNIEGFFYKVEGTKQLYQCVNGYLTKVKASAAETAGEPVILLPEGYIEWELNRNRA